MENIGALIIPLALLIAANLLLMMATNVNDLNRGLLVQMDLLMLEIINA